MPKDYTATKVEGLVLRMKFSTPADPVTKIIDGDNPEDQPTIEYYAAYQIISCRARNGSMVAPVNIAKRYYGVAKPVPWTAVQVGNAMKNFSTFNTVLYNDLKALYIDAINESIE